MSQMQKGTFTYSLTRGFILKRSNRIPIKMHLKWGGGKYIQNQ
jgi:hypothetical protein